MVQIPPSVSVAAEAVGQMFSQAQREITPVESGLWMVEIGRLGPESLLAFAQFWMSGGGQTSSGQMFARAPRIDDFRRYADPSYVDEQRALELLQELVRTVGPYIDPDIADPRLRAAVHSMGGWARICQDLPSRTEDFAFKRFSDVFRQAWTVAQGMEVRGELAAPPLRGLVAAPNQLRLSAQPEAVHSGQEAPTP